MFHLATIANANPIPLRNRHEYEAREDAGRHAICWMSVRLCAAWHPRVAVMETVAAL